MITRTLSALALAAGLSFSASAFAATAKPIEGPSTAQSGSTGAEKATAPRQAKVEGKNVKVKKAPVAKGEASKVEKADKAAVQKTELQKSESPKVEVHPRSPTHIKFRKLPAMRVTLPKPGQAKPATK